MLGSFCTCFHFTRPSCPVLKMEMLMLYPDSLKPMGEDTSQISYTKTLYHGCSKMGNDEGDSQGTVTFIPLLTLALGLYTAFTTYSQGRMRFPSKQPSN